MSATRNRRRIRQLLSENQRLKQKVFELEEKIRKLAPAGRRGTPAPDSSVLKLIEHKDFQLQQYAARLEEKKEQLEEAVRELESQEGRARPVDGGAPALPGALRERRVGADRREPRREVLLFNHTAPQLLGEKFKERSTSPSTRSTSAPSTPTPRARCQEALVVRQAASIRRSSSATAASSRRSIRIGRGRRVARRAHPHPGRSRRNSASASHSDLPRPAPVIVSPDD